MRLDLKQWIFVSIGILVCLAGEGTVIVNGLAWYWAVAVFAVVFACLSFVAKKQEKQRLEKYFADRPALDEKEFGKHYFPAGRAEIAARLRNMLSNHVGVDLARMNPTDHFIEDLRMDDPDSLSTVNFVIEMEKTFSIAIPDTAAERLTTFQSVVEYVAQATKNKGK